MPEDNFGKELDKKQPKIKQFIGRLFSGQRPKAKTNIIEEVEDFLLREQEKLASKDARKKAEEMLDKTIFPSLVQRMVTEATLQGKHMQATRYSWDEAPFSHAYISIIFDRHQELSPEDNAPQQIEKETQIMCTQNGTIYFDNHRRPHKKTVLSPHKWIDKPLVQERALMDAMEHAASIHIVTPRNST